MPLPVFYLHFLFVHFCFMPGPCCQFQALLGSPGSGPSSPGTKLRPRGPGLPGVLRTGRMTADPWRDNPRGWGARIPRCSGPTSDAVMRFQVPERRHQHPGVPRPQRHHQPGDPVSGSPPRCLGPTPRASPCPSPEGRPHSSLAPMGLLPPLPAEVPTQPSTRPPRGSHCCRHGLSGPGFGGGGGSSVRLAGILQTRRPSSSCQAVSGPRPWTQGQEASLAVVRAIPARTLLRPVIAAGGEGRVGAQRP